MKGKIKLMSITICALLFITLFSAVALSAMDLADETRGETTNAGYQSTITLPPVKDAYVHREKHLFGQGSGSKMNINYGSDGHLYATYYEGTVYSSYSQIYIEFNLSSIPGSTISSATLRLYRRITTIWPERQPELGVHDVYKVIGPWQEDEITWNKKPGRDQNYRTDACKVHRNHGGWVEWDVTSDVVLYKQGQPFNGWVIILDWDQASIVSNCYFSKESVSRDKGPQLVVRYGGEEPPPEVVVEITQPEPLWVYLNGNRLFKITYPEEIPVAVLLNDGLVIRATASAPAGINRVEFTVGDMGGNIDIHTDYNAPYEWDWDPQGWGFNMFVLNAKAFDNAGGSADDDFLMIRIM